MWKTFCFSAILFLFARCSYADYIGAVVEYNPVNSSSPELTVEENVKNYVYQIEQAKGFGVQLIVFPEYGLTGIVENPDGYALNVPNVGTSNFSNSHYFLERLSNAAQEYQIYVVVNLLEQTNSTNNVTIYYNTDLVFSSNGTLIAKYRKINLFSEPRLTAGTDVVTFTTYFGTFGLVTCMDILYNKPSQTVLQNTGVTDVIFVAAWTSYVPFYASLEVQVSYALANKVNVLASNINDPNNGRGGSGIYSSDGTILRRILTDTPATNIVFANILPPSSARSSFSLKGFDILDNNTRAELANFKNLTDFQYDLYVYKPLNLSQGNITEEICDGRFCCTFNIGTTSNEVNSSEVYKLVAYSGKAQFGPQDVYIKQCSLVACLNQDISSCGVRPSTPYTTRFRRIVVWANINYNDEDFYRPISLGGNLQPVYNVTYLENRSNETYGVSMNITQPATNVVLFGIYGKSGTEALSVSLILVAIIVAIQGLF